MKTSMMYQIIVMRDKTGKVKEQYIERNTHLPFHPYEGMQDNANLVRTWMRRARPDVGSALFGG